MGACVGTPIICADQCGSKGSCNPKTGKCPNEYGSGTKCFCIDSAPIPTYEP
jgi:hypothetical protein